MTLKVAAYYPWVYLKGGAERTLCELLQRSRHDWTLYSNHYDPESTFPGFGNVRVVELARVSVRRTALHAGHAALTLLTQRLPLQDEVALMVCCEGLGNLATLRTTSLPMFCLCLTPLRVAHDPHSRRRFVAEAGWHTRAAVAAFRGFDRATWQRFERIFAISDEVRSRILRSHLAPAEQVETARPGVDLDEYQPDGKREPFFLLPGRIMWTKNVELGIDALRLLKARSDKAGSFRLVVAGMVDRKSMPYVEMLRARSADLGGAVTFLQCPSDIELRDLYHRCSGVLFTAFNEDWGLVPLEAMASARPVISVNRGGPRESIVDGKTGYLVEPTAEAFAGAMERLVSDPGLAARMGRKGRHRAADFGWSPFVDRIDEFVDSLVDRCSRPNRRG